MAPAKKKGGEKSDRSEVARAKPGPPDSTRAILDRYKSLGAEYVRRTETLGFVVLTEIGIPSSTGNPVFLSLSGAEARLAQGKRAKPFNEETGEGPVVSLPPSTPVRQRRKENLVSPVVAGPSRVQDWAEEVEEEERQRSLLTSRGKEAQAVPARAQSPKGKGKARAISPTVSRPKAENPKKQAEPAPTGPDWEKRAVARFHMTLTELEAVPKEQRPELNRIMRMSQREYNFFRAQRIRILEGTATTQVARQAELSSANRVVEVADSPSEVQQEVGGLSLGTEEEEGPEEPTQTEIALAKSKNAPEGEW